MTPVHVQHSWDYFVRKLAWQEKARGDAALFA